MCREVSRGGEGLLETRVMAEHLSFGVSRLSRLSVPFPRSPASQFRRVLPTTTPQPTPPQVCTLLLSVRCSITVYGYRIDGATGRSLLIMIPPV